MPQFCTCGAELPPDALFCHKCGKPQREVAAQEEPEAAVEAVPAPVFTPSTAPSFRNPAAVRVGLMLASLAALLTWIPIVGLLHPVWYFTAGFLGPFAYRRLTGQPLSTRNGARMGWVVGVFLFLITTIGAAFHELLNSGAGLTAAMREQIRNMPITDPRMQSTVEALQTPAGIAFLLIFGFMFIFGFTMVLCTAGGALGAKIARKD
jgi:hypothetical protein